MTFLFHFLLQSELYKGEQLKELLALLLPPLLHIYPTGFIWLLVENQKEIKSYF